MSFEKHTQLCLDFEGSNLNDFKMTQNMFLLNFVSTVIKN